MKADRVIVLLADCVSEQFALVDQCQPPMPGLAIRVVQLFLHETEVPAQNMRHIRVDGGEVDHETEQLRQTRPCPAVAYRDAQPADTGFPQPADLFPR